jgi:hypothetical protein
MSATGVIRQLGAELANFRMSRHPTTIRGRHQDLRLGRKAREPAALKSRQTRLQGVPFYLGRGRAYREFIPG